MCYVEYQPVIQQRKSPQKVPKPPNKTNKNLTKHRKNKSGVIKGVKNLSESKFKPYSRYNQNQSNSDLRHEFRTCIVASKIIFPLLAPQRSLLKKSKITSSQEIINVVKHDGTLNDSIVNQSARMCYILIIYHMT